MWQQNWLRTMKIECCVSEPLEIHRYIGIRCRMKGHIGANTTELRRKFLVEYEAG